MSDPESLIMASARPGERSYEEEECGAEGGRVAVVVEVWVLVGGSVVDGARVAAGSRVAVMMGARVLDGDRVAVESRVAVVVGGSIVAVVVGAWVAVGGSVAQDVQVKIFFLGGFKFLTVQYLFFWDLLGNYYYAPSLVICYLMELINL